MPIYEYRCPEGHTFELFQRMSDPPPESCTFCAAGPVEKVLYPVAVHFKGSGFYSTDYGRGGKRREGPEGDGAGSDGKAADAAPAKTEKNEKSAKPTKPAKAET